MNNSQNADNSMLYIWLKYQWNISNHPKYQKYFEPWIINLVDSQISGFDKMRLANYINENN